MPALPFSITGINIEEIVYQINELLRILYEDRIGGYDKNDLTENRVLGLDSKKNVVSTGITGEDFVFYAGKQ